MDHIHETDLEVFEMSTDHRPPARAFTTIELLVVIGIIVVLIGLLVPVVSKVRDSARAANTASFISNLSTAIEQYYQDFKAYPGPLSNNEIRSQSYAGFNYVTPWPTDYQAASGDATDGRFRITMAENLVLGLVGGLKPRVDTAGNFSIVYDPTIVGKGPLSLNPAQPRAYQPYIEASNLSWDKVNDKLTGAFFDEASGAAGADDSIIPEFVDRYSDPMPILVLRSRVAASRANPAAAPSPADNTVISNDPTVAIGRPGSYDLSQIIGYTQPAVPTGNPIGVGKKFPKYLSVGTIAQPNPINDSPQHGLRSVNLQCTTTNPPPSNCAYMYPYDAFAYFRDPTLSGSQDPATRAQQTPRQKDKFILISAGPDRIYGTNDDITNFGSVAP